MGPQQFAEQLEQARKRAGLGLRELGRKAGLSPGALSAIEKGHSSPTLATLHKILRALGTDFAGFFAASRERDESPVFQARNMHPIEDAYRKYVLLFPKRQDIRFQVVHETIAASEKDSEWEVHDCDVGGFILSGGPARLEICGRGCWRLRRGDAFYVNAGLKHRLVNAGTKALRQITVWYPPRY